jgi:hypothetical protein
MRALPMLSTFSDLRLLPVVIGLNSMIARKMLAPHADFCRARAIERWLLDAYYETWYAASDERRWCVMGERICCAGSANALHTDSMGELNC